jgi:hypothetical protein
MCAFNQESFSNRKHLAVFVYDYLHLTLKHFVAVMFLKIIEKDRTAVVVFFRQFEISDVGRSQRKESGMTIKKTTSNVVGIVRLRFGEGVAVNEKMFHRASFVCDGPEVFDRFGF